MFNSPVFVHFTSVVPNLGHRTPARGHNMIRRVENRTIIELYFLRSVKMTRMEKFAK